MTEERYRKLALYWQEHPKGAEAVKALNRTFTTLVYILYPAFLLYLIVSRDSRFWRCLLVPAVSFAAVTIVRKKVGCPRPYERWNASPLIAKESTGNSFPSRHVFSAFVIAMAFFCVSPWLGAVGILAGTVIGVMRVAGGVHYPSDVIAAAAMGIACGSLCFI